MSDLRAEHGRELFFDAEAITKQLLERYLNKIYRLQENSLPSFKFKGEIDVGNKIGDVKDRVNQSSIPG